MSTTGKGVYDSNHPILCFVNEFKMHILYASEYAAVEPVEKFAELSWHTKNGETHFDEMDDVAELWNSEYDKLFVTSLAKTGVKSESIDLREVEGYQVARFLEFSRLTMREGWRLGWKMLLKGNYAAGVLEEKKKSFWELFEKRCSNLRDIVNLSTIIRPLGSFPDSSNFVALAV